MPEVTERLFQDPTVREYYEISPAVDLTIDNDTNSLL